MLKRLLLSGNVTREWKPTASPVPCTSLPSPAFFRATLHNATLSTSAAGLWVNGDLVRPELAGLHISHGGTRHFFAYNATNMFGFGEDEHGQAQSPLMGGAAVVACGWDTSAAIGDDGQLHVWGRTGDLLPSEELDGSGAVKAFRGISLRNVVLGFSHAVVLARNGDAFAFGVLDRHGQGGWPVRHVASKIVQIAAGSTHSLLLSSEGEVFSFGSCGDGKLGREDAKDCSEPLPVEFKEKVVSIAAGCDHSVAVTASGEAFAWGFGQHGATGTGRLATEPVPRRVDLKDPVEQVWCGTDFSLFQTK
jgi:alpha-tubulin suppressor-like RCC1 family protein